MSAKTLYFCSLIIGLSAGCVVNLATLGRGGFYLPGIDFLFCTTPKTCIHEEGHRLDAKHGFISESIEYQVAINVFAIAHPDHPWSHAIRIYKDDWSEMYAQIYESVDGNIDQLPAEFQPFYRGN